MNIFERVSRLKLPLGKYVIFGSGPLEAHGIRETRDADLLVMTDLFERLMLDDTHFKLKYWEGGDRYLFGAIGDYEITDMWNYGEYVVTPQEIISRAEIIKKLPFAPLEDVLAWKKAFNREKDRRDVVSIQSYLHKLNQ